MAAIAGVIVAGGRALRMKNLDKPLLPLAGKPIIQYVIDLARPQVNCLLISVNRNLDCYRRFDLPLVTDLAANCDGPLAGIYSAMQWIHEQGIEADYLACFPADVPAFPSDVVSQLHASLKRLADAKNDSNQTGDTVAWCQTGDQPQPLFSLWPFTVREELKQALARGIHGPRLFFQTNPNLALLVPAPQPLQFFNINTPEQLAEAEQLIDRVNRER